LPRPYRRRSAYDESSTAGRLVAVLLDELARSRQAGIVSTSPTDRRLITIYNELHEKPDDARTLVQWADAIGLTERKLAQQIGSLSVIANAHGGFGHHIADIRSP
jgi:hypothetical protein